MTPEIEQAIIDTIGQVSPTITLSFTNNLPTILAVSGAFLIILVLLHFLSVGLKGRVN
jgi:hypothetical protein